MEGFPLQEGFFEWVRRAYSISVGGIVRALYAGIFYLCLLQVQSSDRRRRLIEKKSERVRVKDD